MTEPINIYTDGACRGNPGKGGIGIILKYKDLEKEFKYAYSHTTNNRMELKAIITALIKIKPTHFSRTKINIYSDSKYVVDAINKGWLENWKRKKYKGVKNPDLWAVLDTLLQKINTYTFNWIKGHSGHLYNEKCDKLANQAIDEGNFLKDTNYENIAN